MTDYSELVKTLRGQATDLTCCGTLPRQRRDTQYEIDASIDVLRKAADAISMLTARVAELEKIRLSAADFVKDREIVSSVQAKEAGYMATSETRLFDALNAAAQGEG